MNLKHLEQINKAELAVKTNEERVRNDPHRLAYHIMAPAHWMNDPNGLLYVNGEYHVFYQHHPFDPYWGSMHWGHVRSKDLVHWERLPIALAPSEEYDQDGCFSGSAVVDDEGRIILFYTGNQWLDQSKEKIRQTQCMAISTDGVCFIKDRANPVIAEPPFPCDGHFRDPKVWKHDDAWFMILGTKEEGKGKVVLYRSFDLRQWEYRGVIAESDGTLGYMWECPDLFSLNGHEVLLFSPQGVSAIGNGDKGSHTTGYFVGHFDYETVKYTHDKFHVLDHGFDFYAAQTFLDGQGRRILIGWMDRWDTKMPTQEKGWAGALTVPRVLNLTDDGRIRMQPVQELQKLRGRAVQINELEIMPGDFYVHPELRGDRLELMIFLSLKKSNARFFELDLRCSQDGSEKTVLRYDFQQSVVTLDRNLSGIGEGGVSSSTIDVRKRDEMLFHLLIDRSSVEIFINEGEIVMTSRIYPSPTSDQIRFAAEGGSVCLQSVQGWLLKDIWTPIPLEE
ncbi:glycoside hydrolase family 32 protein [Thermicanus aegyptius]|uniref:glycoside hydrolase family 32 protein n=1 Tax=Thermicanus aegyptius TaxID=94009 RepID=UPI00041CF1C6|nr:glycoside hydrolase family 32 protein [Thermicanus aegyptius]